MALLIIKEINPMENRKNLFRNLVPRKSYQTINLPGISLKDSGSKDTLIESDYILQKTLVISV